MFIPCKFFAQGACKYGAVCRFSHEIAMDSSSTAPERQTKKQNLALRHKPPQLNALAPSFAPTGSADLTIPSKLPNKARGPKNDGLDNTNDKDIYCKEIRGVKVNFSAGAEVAEVNLPSDYSAIQILGLQPNSPIPAVINLLADIGFQVQQPDIKIKSRDTFESVVEVRVKDPNFATAVAERFSQLPRTLPLSREPISVKVMQSSTSLSGPQNRLHMSSVNCTWYKASRVAWLHYPSMERARAGLNALEKHGKIKGRQLQCSVQKPEMPMWSRRSSMHHIYSVRVGNLDIDITDKDFSSVLYKSLAPRKIIIGPQSHPFSDEEASRIIEKVLNADGNLQSFESFSIPVGGKMKAVATFTDRTGANKAVQTFHDKELPQLGNSKVFMTPIISFKHNLLKSIQAAIQPDLDGLKQDIWHGGHTHLKIYPPTAPEKPVVTLRVFGEDSKRVVEANNALKALLAGTIVMHGEVALWDDSFRTPNFIAYLNELCKAHKLYIHRNLKESQLCMYGGGQKSQKIVQDVLMERIDSLKYLHQTINLDATLLKCALQGGWQRIKGRFGERATLCVSSQPKTITIRGSLQEVQQAQFILIEDDGINTDASAVTEDDCPVCWCEPTEPLKIPCGHVYCKDCLQNQCVSASDGNLPVKCFGAGSKCEYVFTMDDLKSMLSLAAYEELLLASFEFYTRSHPAEFHGCPTPDCPQIYRRTNNGSLFFCSECLTSICTTCNVISHDDMTCEQNRELNSEDTKQLRKWMASNDVRDCPKCKMSIEKISGCNHMECALCKAHICWFCMSTFESGPECYDHMSKAHRDWYGD